VTFTCGCNLKFDDRESYAAHLKLDLTKKCKVTRMFVESLATATGRKL